MARGPKKHMKRLNAPKHWMLSKLGGTWAPRPSQGPHKLRECLPLCLILRNRLKYALTRQETTMIVMRRLVKVDHKVRTDINYPAGFMDVVAIEKTGEHYRLLFDVKGKYILHKVSEEEAKFKLCKVQKIAVGSKATIGRNPHHTGHAASIPYIVTHDGRTMKFPHPAIGLGDSVKFDLTTGKIVSFCKFEVGNVCMITRGANAGRVGVMQSIEKHPGSFTIVHLKDRRGALFATRSANVFVIGEGSKPWISLSRDKGIALTVIETRDKNETKGKKKD